MQGQKLICFLMLVSSLAVIDSSLVYANKDGKKPEKKAVPTIVDITTFPPGSFAPSAPPAESVTPVPEDWAPVKKPKGKLGKGDPVKGGEGDDDNHDAKRSVPDVPDHLKRLAEATEAFRAKLLSKKADLTPLELQGKITEYQAKWNQEWQKIHTQELQELQKRKAKEKEERDDQDYWDKLQRSQQSRSDADPEGTSLRSFVRQTLLKGLENRSRNFFTGKIQRQFNFGILEKISIIRTLKRLYNNGEASSTTFVPTCSLRDSLDNIESLLDGNVYTLLKLYKALSDLLAAARNGMSPEQQIATQGEVGKILVRIQEAEAKIIDPVNLFYEFHHILHQSVRTKVDFEDGLNINRTDLRDQALAFLKLSPGDWALRFSSYFRKFDDRALAISKLERHIQAKLKAEETASHRFLSSKWVLLRDHLTQKAFNVIKTSNQKDVPHVLTPAEFEVRLQSWLYLADSDYRALDQALKTFNNTPFAFLTSSSDERGTRQVQINSLQQALDTALKCRKNALNVLVQSNFVAPVNPHFVPFDQDFRSLENLARSQVNSAQRSLNFSNFAYFLKDRNLKRKVDLETLNAQCDRLEIEISQEIDPLGESEIRKLIAEKVLKQCRKDALNFKEIDRSIHISKLRVWVNDVEKAYLNLEDQTKTLVAAFPRDRLLDETNIAEVKGHLEKIKTALNKARSTRKTPLKVEDQSNLGSALKDVPLEKAPVLSYLKLEQIANELLTATSRSVSDLGWKRRSEGFHRNLSAAQENLTRPLIRVVETIGEYRQRSARRTIELKELEVHLNQENLGLSSTYLKKHIKEKTLTLLKRQSVWQAIPTKENLAILLERVIQESEMAYQNLEDARVLFQKKMNVLPSSEFLLQKTSEVPTQLNHYDVTSSEYSYTFENGSWERIERPHSVILKMYAELASFYQAAKLSKSNLKLRDSILSPVNSLVKLNPRQTSRVVQVSQGFDGDFRALEKKVDQAVQDLRGRISRAIRVENTEWIKSYTTAPILGWYEIIKQSKLKTQFVNEIFQEEGFSKKWNPTREFNQGRIFLDSVLNLSDSAEQNLKYYLRRKLIMFHVHHVEDTVFESAGTEATRAARITEQKNAIKKRLDADVKAFKEILDQFKTELTHEFTNETQVSGSTAAISSDTLQKSLLSNEFGSPQLKPLESSNELDAPELELEKRRQLIHYLDLDLLAAIARGEVPSIDEIKEQVKANAKAEVARRKGRESVEEDIRIAKLEIQNLECKPVKTEKDKLIERKLKKLVKARTKYLRQKNKSDPWVSFNLLDAAKAAVEKKLKVKEDEHLLEVARQNFVTQATNAELAEILVKAVKKLSEKVSAQFTPSLLDRLTGTTKPWIQVPRLEVIDRASPTESADSLILSAQKKEADAPAAFLRYAERIKTAGALGPQYTRALPLVSPAEEAKSQEQIELADSDESLKSFKAIFVPIPPVPEWRDNSEEACFCGHVLPTTYGSPSLLRSGTIGLNYPLVKVPFPSEEESQELRKGRGHRISVCGHIIHKTCLADIFDQFYKNKKKDLPRCPICHAPLPFEELEDQELRRSHGFLFSEVAGLHMDLNPILNWLTGQLGQLNIALSETVPAELDSRLEKAVQKKQTWKRNWSRILFLKWTDFAEKIRAHRMSQDGLSNREEELRCLALSQRDRDLEVEYLQLTLGLPTSRKLLTESLSEAEKTARINELRAELQSLSQSLVSAQIAERIYYAGVSGEDEKQSAYSAQIFRIQGELDRDPSLNGNVQYLEAEIAKSKEREPRVKQRYDQAREVLDHLKDRELSLLRELSQLKEALPQENKKLCLRQRDLILSMRMRAATGTQAHAEFAKAQYQVKQELSKLNFSGMTGFDEPIQHENQAANARRKLDSEIVWLVQGLQSYDEELAQQIKKWPFPKNRAVVSTKGFEKWTTDTQQLAAEQIQGVQEVWGSGKKRILEQLTGVLLVRSVGLENPELELETYANASSKIIELAKEVQDEILKSRFQWSRSIRVFRLMASPDQVLEKGIQKLFKKPQIPTHYTESQRLRVKDSYASAVALLRSSLKAWANEKVGTPLVWSSEDAVIHTLFVQALSGIKETFASIDRERGGLDSYRQKLDDYLRLGFNKMNNQFVHRSSFDRVWSEHSAFTYREALALEFFGRWDTLASQLKDSFQKKEVSDLDFTGRSVELYRLFLEIADRQIQALEEYLKSERYGLKVIKDCRQLELEMTQHPDYGEGSVQLDLWFHRWLDPLVVELRELKATTLADLGSQNTVFRENSSASINPQLEVAMKVFREKRAAFIIRKEIKFPMGSNRSERSRKLEKETLQIVSKVQESLEDSQKLRSAFRGIDSVGGESFFLQWKWRTNAKLQAIKERVSLQNFGRLDLSDILPQAKAIEDEYEEFSKRVLDLQEFAVNVRYAQSLIATIHDLNEFISSEKGTMTAASIEPTLDSLKALSLGAYLWDRSYLNLPEADYLKKRDELRAQLEVLIRPLIDSLVASRESMKSEVEVWQIREPSQLIELLRNRRDFATQVSPALMKELKKAWVGFVEGVLEKTVGKVEERSPFKSKTRRVSFSSRLSELFGLNAPIENWRGIHNFGVNCYLNALLSAFATTHFSSLLQDSHERIVMNAPLEGLKIWRVLRNVVRRPFASKELNRWSLRLLATTYLKYKSPIGTREESSYNLSLEQLWTTAQQDVQEVLAWFFQILGPEVESQITQDYLFKVMSWERFKDESLRGRRIPLTAPIDAFKTQPSSILTVPLRDGYQSMSDLVAINFSYEEMKDRDIREIPAASTQPKTTVKGLSDRYTAFRVLPRNLLVQLGRFEYNAQTQVSQKIRRMVDITESVTLREFEAETESETGVEKLVSNPTPGRAKRYQLEGVIYHVGGESLNGGHYLFAQFSGDGNITIYNDDKEPLRFTEIRSMKDMLMEPLLREILEGCYLLFYKSSLNSGASNSVE